MTSRRTSRSLSLSVGIALGLAFNSPAAPNINESTNIISEQLPRPSEPQTPGHNTLFETIAPSHSGIDFIPAWELPEEYVMHLTSFASTAGVAIGDYDSDGKPDVFLANMSEGGRLYRNLGDFRFEDITEKANLDMTNLWATGVTFADINNDGHLDLYICAFDCPNRLYLNQGDGTFIEKGKEFGLDFHGASTMMAFCDYDRDGDLDGYLVTNSTVNFGTVKPGKGKIVNGKVILPPEFDELAYVMYLPNGKFRIVPAGQFDHFYRNNGGTSFTNISKEVGIHGPNHHGLSAAWWDYNGDHWPDLYVANDFHGPDHLYKHNGNPKKPRFTDVVRTVVPHVPWYSMGTDIGDLNNDGHLDLMGADMSPSSHYRSKLTMGDMTPNAWFLDYADPPQYMRNILLLNSGKGTFMEAAQMCGLSSTDWTWTVRMVDLDCDGWLDIFLTTGMTRDFMNTDTANEVDKIKRQFPADADGIAQRKAQAAFWKDKPLMNQPNVVYRNEGGLKFKESGKDWGLDENGVSFGSASGDLDGDGDLDLVINNFTKKPTILRNHTGSDSSSQSNRIKIRLRGRSSNSHGIGATVRLKSDAGEQMRYHTLARGYLSSSEPVLYFGLGGEDKIHTLTIDWPSGHHQEFENLETNRAYTITEPEGSPAKTTSDPSPAPLLTENSSLQAKHRETPFDDFAVQPLLPNRLSQLGPGLAWGDLNGDGKEDFVLGGAAGQPTQVYFHRPNGFGVLPGNNQTLMADRQHEDLAPLLLDVDSDGDQDLYVVSGGVECPPNSPLLADRLYLNDGKGNLSRSSADALPEINDSGGTVVAADYDRDGDLDLFVGGRVVPGQYPSVPKSRLLRNETIKGESPRFIDATTEDASNLLETGMVTGALWTDTNNNGWLDLVVTHEWGPVKVFRNQEGKLVDETEQAGLSNRLGWYNGITGGDLDHDGDIDLVVTNFGRNTKYHPTAKAPVHIYYGDFDGSGVKQIVEAKEKDNCLLPTRGKSCSQNAMPFLRQKLPTYESFASKLLPDIYTPDKLEESTQLTANDLDSGVLLNKGDGSFTFHSLPNLAQISPGFGVALTDLDCDSHLDLIIAQNFFGPQRETGRMNGGVGAVLLGDGHGGFAELWPNESGLDISDDTTALTVVDLNKDHAPDLVFGVNNGKLRVSLGHRPKGGARHLKVQLKGPAGNPSAVGAKVTLKLQEGSQQVAEVHAGDGYLSQSPPHLHFSLAAGQTPAHLEVRWPDGSISNTKASSQETTIVIRQPES